MELEYKEDRMWGGEIEFFIKEGLRAIRVANRVNKFAGSRELYHNPPDRIHTCKGDYYVSTSLYMVLGGGFGVRWTVEDGA